MSKKDLFKKQNPNKFISSANYDKLKEEVESKDFIKEKIKTQKSFTPRTDFSKPENFARYGLAEEYYRTSVEYIYNSYPYDGSLYEREDWYNRGTYLDQYIFENLYPRTNGYVVLGDGWGSQDATVGDYSLSEQSEYIGFTGGPHLGFDPAGDRTISKANYFKASKNRENNLKLDLEDGVTVEFWLKKGAFDNTLTKKEVLFDLWNNNLSSSADYGRLTIELSASAVSSDHVFLATCQSGTVGYFQEEIGNLTTAAIADDNWHHYAVSFTSASTGVSTKFYRDGQYVEEKVLGTAFSDATAAKMSANIGALVNAPSGNVYHGEEMLGYGKVLSSSFDEFRYWKTERNAKQIFQNYNNQVGGGTNTDDANTLLGVYFKFNEGVTGTDTDKTVLDYSGRVSNGSWTGYEAGDRNVGSAIVSASASSYEYKDPIIYSFHPDVSTLKSNLENSGSVHDNLNTSALFFSLPSWIIEEDESYGGENLRHLTQIMGSYLDTLYLQIEELKDLKSVEYTSGSVKPISLGERLLSDKGMLAPDLFVDMDIVEQFYNRNEKTDYQTDLTKIKNKIYENLYNNLTHIYKSKGTYDSFRNALNSLGISQNIVDINLYSNDARYEILDNTKLIIDNKKKINFKDPDNNSATIHQFSSSAEPSKSFISGSGTGKYYYTPITIDSCLTLPSDKIGANFYYQTITNSYLTCSLFGFHDVDEAQAETDLTWLSPDQNQLQAHAIRPTLKTPDGYFLLTGSVGGANIELTSSTVKDLFTNTNWNVSVRFKHVNYPLTQRVSGAFDISSDAYLLEFSGYNASTNYIENEFKVTASVSEAQGLLFTEASKRLYVGAHRENFTGSVYQNGYSFAKISNINFWYNYLSDNDLKSHLRDLHNYGITNSERDAYLLDSNYSTKVKNIDTLMLRWDFETVTGSDSSGNFTVNDLGNFQGDTENQYYHSGKGFGFEASSTDVAKKEKVATYKLAPYDTISSNEMISILSRDDEFFSLERRPINYYFAAEKSFYKAVDDRILEYFSTLKDFNNLVGESANRYRPEYKQLKKYRQYFFNKVQNELDFERFLDYYKWVDTSIAMVIEQLIPATAEFSNTVWNVIESHVLERNKFQHKLPVIKPQTVYETTIQVAPNSYPFSTKGKRYLDLQNPNPVTSSEFLTASFGQASTFEFTSSLKNVVSIDPKNANRKLYITGSDQLNNVGVARTKLKDQKGYTSTDGFHSVMVTEIKGNDNYFLDPFASVVTTTDSTQVSGVVDYTLPTRPSQPQFIRTRFAAPGGYEVSSLGYLDFETSQFSVYNNLNYRNLIVRKALDELYTIPDDDPNLLESPEDGSYFLGIYRNPRKQYVTSSSGFVTQSYFDNGFIQNPLPPSDLQYTWIKQSYSSSNLEFLLNQTGPEDIVFKPQTFYSWVVSPSSATNIYGTEIDTSSNTSTVVIETPSASNNYFSSIGKFGYNTWTQLRNGENLIARTHRKNNIISIADNLEIVDINQKGIVANSFTNYIEPVLNSKYKPVRHTLVLDNEREDIVDAFGCYGLSLAFFANKELNERLTTDKSSYKTGYDKIKELYLSGAKFETNPIKGWVSVEYSERLWPKGKSEGLNSHRSKENYESTSSELLNNLCQYRTIWKDTAINRKRGDKTGFPYTNAKNSVGIVDPFAENIFPLSDYSLTNTEPAHAAQTVTMGTTATISAGEFFQLNAGGFEVIIEGQATAANDNFNEFYVGTESFDGLRHLANKINQHPTASQYFFATDLFSGSSAEHTMVIFAKTPGTQGNEYSITGSAIFFEGSPLVEPVFLADGVDANYNRDGELNAGFLGVGYTNPQFKGQGTNISFRSTYKPASYFGSIPNLFPKYNSTNFNADSYYSASSYCSTFSEYYYPTASQDFIHRPRPAQLTASTDEFYDEVAPYNGHPWRVAQSSSRSPFFNSYEEYVQNPKVLSSDFSIVPEFTFSDHVDYYYDQKGGDLRAANKKILEIKGATGVTASAESEGAEYNSAFHRDYAYTDYLEKFDNVMMDHRTIGEIGEVTLTCKGIKKFLPKQGFYPVSRATQLGTLFSQSVGPNITGLGTLTKEFTSVASPDVTYTFSQQNTALQAALQPLFAPGVLYNTIKSGIAVDWPIFFEGNLTTRGVTDQLTSSTSVIFDEADKRIPFDAFYNLDLFPRDSNVLYLYPSWHSASSDCSRYPYFNWNGEKSSVLYEKAASNFLAEVQNFFLEKRRNTNIVSDSEKNFKTFESGKTYYMDVSLRQTNNHFMWKDYFDGTVSNNLGDDTSYNGRAFGPGWSLTSLGNDAAAGIGSDPAYAPYTPPYFYGESIARISFAPSETRKYTLDEILASSSVDYLNPELLESAVVDNVAAYTERMSLDSSINLFEKFFRKDTDTNANEFEQCDLTETVAENSAWRISPKFECPTLNFYNQPSEQYYSRGMWGGLGEISSGSEGIFLKVQESFTGSVAAATGSLIEQLGFDVSSHKIGQIASKTRIKEAIVAIPFLERERKNNEEAELTNIDNRNFFKIDKDLINTQLKEGKDTTLTRMHHKMKDYVIPPNYNFAKYGDIDPFVMYIFEFDMEFDKQDLAYMWQGVMPDPSLNGNEEFESVTINHKTGKDEFYHGKQIPTDIRWLVFKVKQKAKKDYEKVVKLQAQDDEEYGYNWPYDYCSVVELAKVEASFKIVPKETVEEAGIKLGKILQGEE